MKNNINFFRKATLLLLSVVATVFITGCEEHKLPEANSIADTDPPEAGFSYASDATDFRLVNFTNLSEEATTFLWDFGGGNTSTELDPSFTFEDGEGTYSVTLTSTDGLGVSNSITQDVVVEEGPFQPIILEPGFEDGQLDGGSGDGRDSWRNNGLGGVIQISGSPVVSGDQGAKLTGSAGDQRIGYQEIVVEAETNYAVNFIYTIVSAPVGYLTVDILDASGGTLTSHADTQDVVLGSVTVNNQEDPNTYEPGKVSFNSGTSTLVAIYFYNGGSVESRLDDFTIDISAAGAVPPSAAFSSEQSVSNFLEYTFTNGSLNANSYEWDFGDGNTSTEESPTHVYASPDIYTIMLTAKNDGGAEATFSSNIDIQDPVTADFTSMIDAVDYKTYSFTDASVNAASVLWDFGDGNLSKNVDPTHTYTEDGIYTVTLTATSSTGLTDEVSEELTVALGFVPIIKNPGFDVPGSNGKYNEDWDSRDFGGTGIIQITGSPVHTGAKASKYPSDGTRSAYQVVTVEANKNYTVTYYYTMKTSPVGSLTVAILGDGSTDLNGTTGVTAGVIETQTVNDQSDADTYIESTISFNSGSNTEIAIYVTNVGVESRLDTFSIIEN